MSERMSGLSLYADVRSHDSWGMSEQGVFGEAPYPLRGLLVRFVQLL